MVWYLSLLNFSKLGCCLQSQLYTTDFTSMVSPWNSVALVNLSRSPILRLLVVHGLTPQFTDFSGQVATGVIDLIHGFSNCNNFIRRLHDYAKHANIHPSPATSNILFIIIIFNCAFSKLIFPKEGNRMLATIHTQKSWAIARLSHHCSTSEYR
jgi:hypothetical protein